MNFNDLYKKIRELDNPIVETETTPTTSDPDAIDPAMDSAMEECGMDMMPHSSPKQQDNVTMNVTAQGAGGIRDLMDILRNLEAGDKGHDDIIVGEPSDATVEIPVADEAVSDGDFGAATTRPNEKISGVKAVVPKGNDLHAQGSEAEKVNGGGNPFNVDESLIAKLSSHYQRIKED